MATDPVCGMSIPKSSAAATSTYHGQMYYFCSALCKQLFDRDPEKHLKVEKKTEKSS